jgi:hypothetical protein
VNGLWSCLDCDYRRPKKCHVFEHVEARHVSHPPYACEDCGKLYRTRNTFRQHRIQHKAFHDEQYQ